MTTSMFKLYIFVLVVANLQSCALRPWADNLSTDASPGTVDTLEKKSRSEESGLIKSIATNAAKISAYISIFSVELVASDAAEIELNKFRSGEHDALPIVYPVDSDESAELLKGSYYQELTQHLVVELARWYGWKIPHSGGLFTQADTFRVFDWSDFLTEIVDGVDMADIIGSITYYVRVTTLEGKIYFHTINKMSLESFSGENYFRHGLVNNPQEDAFKSTTQIFHWSTPIPAEYRQ